MAESGLGFQMHRSFGELDRKRGIQAVELRLVDEEDVRKLAVAEIRAPSHLKNHIPVPGGLNDPLLGTFNSDFRCGTCMHGLDKCPGHWGRYTMSAWMFHPGFLTRTVKMLRTLCFWCSRVLVENKQSDRFRPLPASGSRRFDAIHRRIAGTVTHACPHCQGPVPKYRCDRKLFIEAEFAADAAFSTEEERRYAARPFTAEEARRILSACPHEDLEWLGFSPEKSHPRSVVFRSLLIPPNPMRPPIRTSSASKTHGQDDITMKLADIIRADQGLSRRMCAAGWERSQELTDLACELTVYMDRETADVVEASSRKHFRVGANRVLNTVPARLKGKNGRLRRTVIGKRTEFCSRAVIRPASFLKPWEVLVPCMFKLTYPEMVNASNRRFLERCCGYGPNDMRGAVEIELKDGQRVDLAYRQPSARVPLEVGWIVHRRIMGRREKVEVLREVGVRATEEDVEGDFLIVNRQPTLWKYGIMVHEAVINRDPRDTTFGMPDQTTTMYNADFDGDEMNITIPQMTAARVECKHLMHISRNVRSGQSGETVPQLIQDALLGLFMLTRPGVFLTREEVCDLAVATSTPFDAVPPPAVLAPRRLWTGKQAFSMLLPREVTNAWGPPQGVEDAFDMKTVVIVRGQLLCGTLTKRVVGKGVSALPRTIAQDVGDAAAIDFLDRAQALAVAFLASHGFTITREDLELSSPQRRSVAAEMREVMGAYEGFFSDRILKTAPTWTRRLCSGRVLEDALGSVSAMISTKATSDANNVETLNKSGAKGSDTHTAQMRGIIGQVHVGEEGPPRVKGGDRALPCFPRRDASAVAQGFVDACYAEGLSMPQWFFHTMAGRVGLVDTALGTSVIGYLQRCLVKNQEGIATAYDNTVRNSHNAIMDTYYGHNHLDPEQSEQVRVPWLDDDLVRRTFFLLPAADGGEEGEEERRAARQHVRTFRRNRVALAVAMQHGELFPYTHAPINVERLLRAVPASTSSTPPSPASCAAFLRDLRAEVRRVMRGREEPSSEYLAYFDFWMSWHVLRRYGAEDVERLRRKVHRATFAAIIPAGSPTGINCSMSIGAPSTQMTLNTFHLPGVLSKQVTMGVPRLKEIINVQEKMQTPTVTAYFRGAPAEAWVEDFAKSLHACVLSDVVRSSSATIVREPALLSTVVAEDAYLYELSRMSGDLLRTSPAPGLSLRFALDRDRCEDFGVSVSAVADVLRRVVGQQCVVLASTDSCVGWTVRVHFATAHAMASWTQKQRSAREVERAAQSERERVVAALSGAPEPPPTASAPLTEVETHQVMLELRQFLMDHVLIKGIEGVTAATRRKVKVPRLREEEVRHEEELVVDVRGKVFSSVLSMPEVDATRTLSNNIKEVYDVLGVLGARSVIFQELYAVMHEGGINVCPSHLITIASTLTHSGTLTAFTRSGMAAGDQGVLERASFEQTYDVCRNGALFAEAEDITGVTPPIMLGKFPVIGTGAVSLVGEDGKPLPFVLHGEEQTDGGEAEGEEGEEIDVPGIRMAQDRQGQMYAVDVASLDISLVDQPYGGGGGMARPTDNFLDLDGVGGEDEAVPPLELLMETLHRRRRQVEDRRQPEAGAQKDAEAQQGEAGEGRRPKKSKKAQGATERKKRPRPGGEAPSAVVVVAAAMTYDDGGEGANELLAPAVVEDVPAFEIVAARIEQPGAQAPPLLHYEAEQDGTPPFCIVSARP